MKHIFAILIIFFCAVSAKAETFFESCEDIPDLTTVYVSRAMISMAGDLDIDSDNIDLERIASQIDGLWIVIGEGQKASALLRDKAKAFFDKGSYETLMSVRDKTESVDILMKTLGSGKNECVVKALDKFETTIVVIKGSFTFKDIVEATKADL